MKKEENNEKKRLEIQRPQKRGFRGFPIWVWLLLLAIVVGVYYYFSMKS